MATLVLGALGTLVGGPLGGALQEGRAAGDCSRGLRRHLGSHAAAGGEEKRAGVPRGPGPGRPCGMTRGPTGYHFPAGRHIVSRAEQ